MSEVSSTAIFIAAEFGAILLILFVVVFVIFLKRRASDKRYVTVFIEDHKASCAGRREAMREKMMSNLLLREEELDDFLDNINISEKKLYKHILNMYLGFERQCLPEIRDDISDINNYWVETIQKNTGLKVQDSAPEEKTGDLNSKIDELTTENTKMSTDLKKAMETMDDIIKEYSLMYAGEENDKMDSLSDDFQNLKNK